MPPGWMFGAVAPLAPALKTTGHSIRDVSRAPLSSSELEETL